MHHRLFNPMMYTGCGSGEHSRSQRTSLIRPMNANGHSRYISHHLHDERRFFCHAPRADKTFYRNALGEESFHNGFGAKAGGFSYSAENIRRIRSEVYAANHSFQLLVGVWRASSIEPVKGKLGIFSYRYLFCFPGQIRNQFLYGLLDKIIYR